MIAGLVAYYPLQLDLIWAVLLHGWPVHNIPRLSLATELSFCLRSKIFFFHHARIEGQGLSRFLTGAVGFPLTILMVAMSGQGAWTGDAMPALLAYVKVMNSYP